jgi:hypothetical protein
MCNEMDLLRTDSSFKLPIRENMKAQVLVPHASSRCESLTFRNHQRQKWG